MVLNLETLSKSSSYLQFQTVLMFVPCWISYVIVRWLFAHSMF